MGSYLLDDELAFEALTGLSREEEAVLLKPSRVSKLSDSSVYDSARKGLATEGKGFAKLLSIGWNSLQLEEAVDRKGDR
jgi:hypothetical protein